MRLLLLAVLLPVSLPPPVGAGVPPGGCLTPSIAERIHARSRPSGPAPIDRLDARDSGWFSYVSPAGLFEMHYTQTGLDAVRPADVDPPNGIPDLVEDCAIWADVSWEIEVDSLGFAAPPFPADGTYDVTFRWFPGDILGACGPQEEEGPLHTQMYLRRTFSGFGVNPDLLAKSTVAHELKHAIQYLVNQWLEIGWIELDANWVVEHVFDEADYGRVLQYPGSQLSNPEQSLDHGGAGSYGDYLWEEYLWLAHGGQILHDFWSIRGQMPAQPVLDSYRDAQLLHGADWTDSYPEFMEWCWFSGSLAQPGFGFPEADLYIDTVLREPLIATYPYMAADAVAHLACHHRRFSAGNPARSPRILLDGEPVAPLTVSVIAGLAGGGFSIVRPAIDSAGDLDHTVPHPWAALSWVGVIVTNSETVGADRAYSLQVVEEAVTGVGVAAAAHAAPVLRARPNPFTTSVELRAVTSGDGPAVLTVHDVRGRVVRRLGTGAERWDGRSDDGAPVPAGVYWVRLETPAGTAVRAVTRLH
jgi:hypothetical protein